MAVVATGFFDGVHLGHRQVIRSLVSLARRRGEPALAVTFSQHPRTVLQQDAHQLRLLNSPQEKEALLLGLGVDRVETLVFDRGFARLSAEEYLRTVLRDRLGATALVLGYDNRLGSDRLTPDQIRPLAESLGLEVVVVPPATADVAETAAASGNRSHPRLRKREGPDDEVVGRGPAQPDVSRGWLPRSEIPAVVSSSKIRKALSEGRVEEAEAMLGYAYGLRGVVVSGKQLGRTIGFPTANLRLYDPMKMIPGRGVYLTEVEVLGAHYWGMTNVGDILETHIFDFDEDIYGHDLQLRFRRRLREMRPFDSLEALREQLTVDEAACRALLVLD
ncbi:MAG: hypothetical protein IKX62_01140 [Bacteroidales bacterium]|nr:hypothetical protein [Bacteroidales bacterium]